MEPGPYLFSEHRVFYRFCFCFSLCSQKCLEGKRYPWFCLAAKEILADITAAHRGGDMFGLKTLTRCCDVT